AGICLHVHVLYGRNPHHIVEAQFKAVARALRAAAALDPRAQGSVPSTKGVLLCPNGSALSARRSRPSSGRR
ncbi:MAG: hisB, partial [Actinomycetia bacterium]|nr:hisB [Actinomycetes bacterium]